MSAAAPLPRTERIVAGVKAARAAGVDAARRRPVEVAPTRSLIPEVATASDETLVSALIVLTHQTHAAKAAREKTEDRIRFERDLVRAEVLRRMGGAR